MIRSYTEVSKLKTFNERYNYLKLDGVVGNKTFGSSRYLNQMLYKCDEWLSIRPKVIVRDNGCDLGVIGHDIFNGIIIVHHINPITVDDILQRNQLVFDLDNLISTRLRTHNGIHYGTSIDTPNPYAFNERSRNDTCPWKH